VNSIFADCRWRQLFISVWYRSFGVALEIFLSQFPGGRVLSGEFLADVVGIDYYAHVSELTGCVNDAHAVKAMLARHADGSVNFGTRLMVGTGPHDILARSEN